MKAVRSHDYRIDGYGNVKFIKVDIGNGHSTFKVFWRREGAENGTRIGWLQNAKSQRKSSRSFSAKMIALWKTGTQEH